MQLHLFERRSSYIERVNFSRHPVYIYNILCRVTFSFKFTGLQEVVVNWPLKSILNSDSYHIEQQFDVACVLNVCRVFIKLYDSCHMPFEILFRNNVFRKYYQSEEWIFTLASKYPCRLNSWPASCAGFEGKSRSPRSSQIQNEVWLPGLVHKV
jgi:hypothetical protein